MVDKPVTDSDLLVLVCGQVTLDRLRRKVLAGNKTIVLTTAQFALLEFLMLNQGTVVSVEDIRARVWGKAKVDSGAVTVMIHRLRHRLGTAGRIIVAGYGAGYAARAGGKDARWKEANPRAARA